MIFSLGSAVVYGVLNSHAPKAILGALLLV
ncbi:MAG: hypothetical protein QOK08_1743, partial [Actinomycetota bacterium]|nr:hypothetical protein [Actinomycetota bacterium]